MQPSTPCLQSQIGRGSDLRHSLAPQVRTLVALSAVIRWGPVRTAVNGTLVARPVRTTCHTSARSALPS